MSEQLEPPDELAGHIAAYLEHHPQAADTVDGIAHWWVQRQRYRTAATQIQQALDRLQAQGVVSTTTSATGRLVYRSTRVQVEEGRQET